MGVQRPTPTRDVGHAPLTGAALREHIEYLRSFESSHTPQGWPAIQMRELSQLLNATEALLARNAQLEATCNKMAPSDKLTAPSPIAQRVSPPTPAEVLAARTRAGLTQTQAAALISPAGTAAYKTWAGYETSLDNPNHRKIPLATWELFLLVTGQHEAFRLQNK